jgi:putative ABC transport system permease protein
MTLLDLVSTAISNTFRSKLRTTLTVLALFIGAFTLTLTTSVGAGVTDYVTKQVASLGAGDVFIVTRASTAVATGDGPTEYDPNRSTAVAGGTGGGLPGVGASDPLTDVDLATLAGIDGITDAAPVRTAAVDYITAGGTSFEVTINPTSSITRADLASGAQLDNASGRNEIIVPVSYVDGLGFRDAADAVGKLAHLGITDVLGRKHVVDATIVGVSQTSLLSSGSGGNQALITTLADTQAAGVDTGPNRYSIAIAHFDGSASASEVSALKTALSDQGFAAQTIQDQLGLIQTVINGIIGILNAFAIVALIAAAFGIVNTLLMSVQERTREIGLMKAMGMRSGGVFLLFSLEAVFIGFLGSALGAVVAIGLGSVLNGVLAAGPLAALPGLNILLFQPGSIIGIILLIMAVAFLSGTLPARRAARQNPIESLRYE